MTIFLLSILFFSVFIKPLTFFETTVYDDEISIPMDESGENITNQQIKDYYERDKLEKWNIINRAIKPSLKNIDVKTIQNNFNKPDAKPNKMNPNNVNILRVSKSKKFLPNSGLMTIQYEDESRFSRETNDEPITMKMVLIKNLTVPEEISFNNLNTITEEEEASTAIYENKFTKNPNSRKKTKSPFVYEIPKGKPQPYYGELNLQKMKKDVLQLRSEMNLVKILISKLYRKSFKKSQNVVKSLNGTTQLLLAKQVDRTNGR